MKNDVLLIDDDPDFSLKLSLGLPGFDFASALTAEIYNEKMAGRNYELILLDLNLDPKTDKLDGLDLIKRIKTNHSSTPLVIITADEKTETVVTAMKLGADDFLRKSNFDLLAWRRKFELLIENQNLNQRIKILEVGRYSFVGNSTEIEEIKKTLEILAHNPDVTVLISGETGAGKEVAARYLHQHSKRKNKPFVPVNLAALPDTLVESELFGHRKGAFTGATRERSGYFRKADGGILFLDEIGDLPLPLQAKLLRFLEDKIINVLGHEKEIQLDLQVLAATNKNLQKLVKNGKFRDDLYYRIKNFTVEIPPLRERKEDIPILIEYFLRPKVYRADRGMISNSAMEKLQQYHWPGNIRELKNTIDFALIKSENQKIEIAHLPKELNGAENSSMIDSKMTFNLPIDLEERTKKFQLSLIDYTLGRTYGNKSISAKMLNLDLDKLRYRLMAYKSLVTGSKYPNIEKYYKKILQ